MSFLVYDLSFLVIFILFVSLFLYRNKHNIKKEGLLILYKTKWGINLINRVGKNYQKTLKILSYVSIGIGYILMVGGVYFVGKVVYVYLQVPGIVEQIKVPPIMPLIPYLPQAFHLDFLPNFNFTYWIVILAVVAIFHEFAHGIFAVYNKIKVKKTGFGFFPFFLPIFLAAFVELDEKVMAKKSKFAQLTILSSGTFFNVLTALVTFVVMILFFQLTFAPVGVVFNDYSYNIVYTSNVSSINGLNVSGYNNSQIIQELSKYPLTLVNITASNSSYLGVKGFSTDKSLLALYDDFPAIKANLSGAIKEIDGEKITSLETFREVMLNKTPGQEVRINTITKEGEKEYKIVLGNYSGRSVLGVGFTEKASSGFVGNIVKKLSSFKNPQVYYTAGEFAEFIYDLLWWLLLICISVAFVNMLPVGIFDGGRFFYLTVLGITKSEFIAKWSFKIITWLFLVAMVAITVFWAWKVF